MDCDLNGFESSEAGTVPEADNFTQWDFPRDLQILAKYFDTFCSHERLWLGNINF